MYRNAILKNGGTAIVGNKYQYRGEQYYHTPSGSPLRASKVKTVLPLHSTDAMSQLRSLKLK